MNHAHAPISRNDAIAAGLLKQITLFLPSDDKLYQFLVEEQYEDESIDDTAKRLLRERLTLSCKGY